MVYKFCECCGIDIPYVHQHNRRKCVSCLLYHRELGEEVNRLKTKVKKLNLRFYGVEDSRLLTKSQWVKVKEKLKNLQGGTEKNE